MQISFSASGTPDQVNASLYQQSKVARESNPDHAAPTIASLRDYLGHEIAAFPDHASVTVSASVKVEVIAVARMDGQPDVRGADGLIHGEVLPDTGARIGTAEPGAPNVTGVATPAAAPASRPVVDRRKK